MHWAVHIRRLPAGYSHQQVRFLVCAMFGTAIECRPQAQRVWCRKSKRHSQRLKPSFGLGIADDTREKKCGRRLLRGTETAYGDEARWNLATLAHLYKPKSTCFTTTSDAARVSRDFVAIVEGTGDALSLNRNIKLDGIGPAFGGAISGFLPNCRVLMHSRVSPKLSPSFLR